MTKIGSSEQPAYAGRLRRIRRCLHAASTVVALAAFAAVTFSATAATAASTTPAPQAEDDGTDVGMTILGLAIVLAILAALFLLVRRLRR